MKILAAVVPILSDEHPRLAFIWVAWEYNCFRWIYSLKTWLDKPDQSRSSGVRAFGVLKIVFASLGSDLSDGYLPTLRPLRTMLEKRLTTFAQREIKPRSGCHTWRISLNCYLLSLVSGILPPSPDFLTRAYSAGSSPAYTVSSIVPHSKGSIRMSLKRIGIAVTGEIVLPNGLTSPFV